MSALETSNKQLKFGAMLSYLAIGINILSALIYSPWMLQQIGEGDYGLYTLATSLINMFLLDFGISSAVSRFITKNIAQNQQERVNQLLGVVYRLFFAISALISIFLFVVYFFVDQIYVSLTPAELSRFRVVYIISSLYSVVSLPLNATVNGILSSYEKFVQVKLCDVIHKLCTVALIVIALVGGYGLYALVAINAVSNLFFLIVKYFLIKIYTPVKVRFKYRDQTLLKEIFGFSVWVFINSICSRLIMNICPNILGVTAGTAAITIFSFASAIEGYSYSFSSAIDGMFMPRIARITYGENSDHKSEDILNLMIKVGRFQYHLIGLVLIGFAAVGRDFILLWLGNEYMEVYYCALLLLLPAPFYLSQQIAKNTMVVTNQVKYLTFVNIFKAALNVLLASVLSTFWGALGACVSICVSYSFRNIANMYLYKTKLSLNIGTFCKKCYGRMSIAMAITILFSLLLFFLEVNSWIGLIIKVLLIVGIYITSMWFLAYTADEKRAFAHLCRRDSKRDIGK